MRNAYVVGIAEAASGSPADDPFALAVRSASRAIQDAGLERADIDGVLSYGLYGDMVPAEAIGYALGRDQLRLALDFHLGGQAPAALVGMAARCIADGSADAVIVSRGMCGHTGLKVGSVDFPRLGQDLRRASGVTAWAITAALWASRYLDATGLDQEALSEAVLYAGSAVWSAARDPFDPAAPLDFGARALPGSIEQYRDSPVIASPLRRDDCVSEIDGGAAVLVVSETLAERARTTPLRVVGSVWRSKQTDTDMGSVLGYDDLSRNVAWDIRNALQDELGVAPAESDIMSIYDCFSSVMLQSVEGLGLAEFGDGAKYLSELRAGVTNGPWLNPGGGMLVRGYLHGLNNVLDAVRGLRLRGANALVPLTGVVMSGGMSSASAVVLALP